jgi:hypothetical protein
MTRICIVAVHGVGGAVSGDILTSLAPVADSDDDRGFVRQDLILKGQVYPRLIRSITSANGSRVSEIIETNWSDIMRPANSLLGVGKHCIYIPMAMALLSLGTRVTTPGSFLARVHFQLFALTYPWILLSTLLVMAIFASDPASHKIFRWTIGFSVPAVMVFIAWFLGRVHASFRIGYLWAPFTFLVGLAMLCSSSVDFSSFTVFTSGAIYGYMQLVICLTFIGALTAALMFPGVNVGRLASGGFIWIPFLVFCLVGVAIWACALQLAGLHLNSDNFERWTELFLAVLPYNLAVAETSLMLATVACTLIPTVLGLSAYFFPKSLRARWKFPQPGPAVREVLSFGLWFGPLVILAALIVIPATSYRTQTSGAIVEIYQRSALRFYALLPLLLPAARIVLDATGDVIYYLLPHATSSSSTTSTKGLGTQTQTVPRLIAVLRYVRRSHPRTKVVVLAHSQGSILAYAALRSEPELADELITMGSPIASLYGRFFRGEFAHYSAEIGIPWTNLFRSGDYVGGVIPSVCESEAMGTGGHINYWGDPTVHKLIRQRLLFSCAK